MKIIAFNGSARKTWNTATLLSKALEGAGAQGASTELVHLYDVDFKGCVSCFACKTKGGKSYGKCAVRDGLAPLLQKAEEADAFILGSPIYFGAVTGTVSYLQPIALPPEAVVELQLLELPQADAREVAKVVAKEKITLGNRQVPVAFEVKFDPAKIDAKRAYALMARILVGKEVRFTSDPGYPVLTAGNPSHVEMILKQVASVKTP